MSCRNRKWGRDIVTLRTLRSLSSPTQAHELTWPHDAAAHTLGLLCYGADRMPCEKLIAAHVGMWLQTPALLTEFFAYEEKCSQYAEGMRALGALWTPGDHET